MIASGDSAEPCLKVVFTPPEPSRAVRHDPGNKSPVLVPRHDPGGGERLERHDPGGSLP